MDCNGNNNWRYLISKGNWGSYHLIWESDWTFNEVAWTIMTQGINKRLWTTDGAPPGEWIHLGVTYDSDEGSRIYVNGKEDPGKNPEGPANGIIDINSAVLKIAGGENMGCPDGSGFFAGIIDDVAIFGEVLSGADMEAIMNMGLKVSMATIDGLIARKEKCFESGGIDNDGVANSLDQKLKAVKAALDRSQTKVAANILKAFINEVEAQSGKHISQQCSIMLIDYAGCLISKIKGVSQAPLRQSTVKSEDKLPSLWGKMKAK